MKAPGGIELVVAIVVIEARGQADQQILVVAERIVDVGIFAVYRGAAGKRPAEAMVEARFAAKVVLL
jgi:hypothetical protein